MDSTNRHKAKFLERAQTHKFCRGTLQQKTLKMPACFLSQYALHGWCFRLEVGLEVIPGMQVQLSECTVVHRIHNIN